LTKVSAPVFFLGAMRNTLPFLGLLAACGGEKTDVVPERSAQASPVTLDSATVINAQLPNPVISTVHKLGDTVTAIVVHGDSTGSAGVPFLPGAFAHLRLAKFDASGAEFSVDSISIRSRAYTLRGTVAPVKPGRTVAGSLYLDRATTLSIRLSAPLTLVPPND
jgi:hypothetical protein